MSRKDAGEEIERGREGVTMRAEDDDVRRCGKDGGQRQGLCTLHQKEPRRRKLAEKGPMEALKSHSQRGILGRDLIAAPKQRLWAAIAEGKNWSVCAGSTLALILGRISASGRARAACGRP